MSTRTLFLLLIGLLVVSAARIRGAEPADRPFTTEDMLEVRTFAAGQPIAVSLDGGWIAYVLTDIANEHNILEMRPTGYVTVQPIQGGRVGLPHGLTRDHVHSSFPTWSPDGRRLAFFRQEGGGDRLVVWDPQTDQQTPLGDPIPGRCYLAPQWEPSGARIVVARAVEEPASTGVPRVTVVTSADARVPGDAFFTDARRADLAAIAFPSGSASRLLSEPVHLRSYRLAPDGRHAMYVAPTPETFGVVGKEENDTFIVPLSGGLPRRPLPDSAGLRFSWTPDGRHLLFKAKGKLMAVPVDGGEATPYLADLNLPVGELTWSPDGARFVTLVQDETVQDPELTRVPPGMYTIARPFMDLFVVSGTDGQARNVTVAFEDQMSEAAWSPDSQAVYFVATNNVTYEETLYRYGVADQKLTPLARGAESYGRIAPAGGDIVVQVEDATRPRDLWLVNGTTGDRARVTDINPQLTGFRFVKPELFHYYNGDGERLGALLYRPAVAASDRKVPVITYVYEKMTPDMHRFNARHQMFLSHGYAILSPNVKVKVGQPGTSFVKAVVPAVNAVRAMGFTNDRFGLWGHSFGAYATSFIVTQTNIFACAVSGATPPELFRNWASGRDRDSRNIETGQARLGGSPFDVPERYLSQSAFFHLNQVHTPVLILHGVRDLTILFGEGEMMFYALRRLGKEATFVAYANGDHSLSRHSRADTIDVNRRILQWFDRYLKTPEPQPSLP